MNGALSHLVVVEFCDEIPGAACGKQFATWGAEVFVAESPGGSRLRSASPRIQRNGRRHSLTWEFLSAGKSSVAIPSLTRSRGDKFASLLDQADVILLDWSATRLSEIGLSVSELSKRAVVVSLSNFGASGPYEHFQATDLVLQALSGFMALNGLSEREPLKAAGSMPSQAIGVSAFIGAMAALLERDRSGTGQAVEVSSFDALTSLVPLLRSEYSGRDDTRQGAPISGTYMFECRDGYISLNPNASRNWDDLLVGLGVQVETLPPELRTSEITPELARRFVSDRTRHLSAREVFKRLNDLRIPCGLVNGPLELLNDVHLASRQYFIPMQHPSLGSLRFPGPPALMSATPMAAPSPAPIPQEGDEVETFHSIAAQTAHAVKEGWDRQPPLDGVKVIDLTAAWLGPYASMLLADLGADVIKVEAPHRPDAWRGAAVIRPGSPWASRPRNADAHPWNTNSNFNSVNRNKRAIALDLTNAEGRSIFLEMVRGADLVLENFTPRVMSNFGLSFQELRQQNPQLVMVSFSGFGETGPYRDYRANGATTDTTSGWAAITGYRDGPPTMMGTMEADPTTGLQMAACALVALRHARRTGEGQHVEGSMFETSVGYIGEEMLLAQLTGENPPRSGNQHREMAPHGVFRCAGDDDWVAITVRDDQDWNSLVTLVSEEFGLHAERFATTAQRLANVEELESSLTAWTSVTSSRDVMNALQSRGVPAGVVQNYTAVLEDEHLRDRGWFKLIEHPDMGSSRYNGFPWQFSRTPPRIHKAPPRVGEDSAEVLRNECGLSSERISELFAAGVVASVNSLDDIK
ncbi:MAG: CoA transferase [Dehalococcoidia bacterium]